jgi:hypothetical protein
MRLEMDLVDPRKRHATAVRRQDPVHSFMGEFEAGHLRRLGLHSLRLRTESFGSVCPDRAAAFNTWWDGALPQAGRQSVLVVLGPLSGGMRRASSGWTALSQLDPGIAGMPTRRQR